MESSVQTETHQGADKNAWVPKVCAKRYPDNVNDRDRLFSIATIASTASKLEGWLHFKPNIVAESASRLTCHGISDWCSATSKPSFCFWGLAVAMATGVFIFNVIQTFREFSSKPLQTTLEVVPVTSLRFPDVTICPTSYIDTAAFEAQESVVPDRITVFNKFLFNPLSVANNEIKDLIMTSMGTPTTSKQSRILSPDPAPLGIMHQEVLQVAVPCSTFMKQCLVDGEFCTNSDMEYSPNISCHQSAVRKVVDMDWGVCYVVSVSQVQKYPRRGLKLTIDLKKEPSAESNIWATPNDPPAPEEPTQTQISRGITVRFAEKFSPFQTDGLLVGTGLLAKMQIRHRETKLLSSDSLFLSGIFNRGGQPCVSRQNLANSLNLEEPTFVTPNTSYSQEACAADCAMAQVLETESCVFPLDLSFVQNEYHSITTTFCNATKTLKSLANLLDGQEQNRQNLSRQNVARQNSDGVNVSTAAYKKCVNRCERPCRSVTYDVELSYHKLDSFNTDMMGMEFFPLGNDKKALNIIVLDIAYAEIQKSVIVQNPSMTFNTLLANLGGIFGLWLGGSLFTVFQIAVFCGKFVFSFCQKHDTVVHITT